MVFLPTNAASRAECEKTFEEIVGDEGLTVLGWRSVPTDSTSIGLTSKASEPVIRQLFIARGEAISDDLAFERKLCVIRKRVSKAAKRGIHERGMFYVPSLSCRTIVYKGMLTADQLPQFYSDLRQPLVESDWPWSTHASAPIPFPVGHVHTPIVISPTTAKSTPSRQHQLDESARKQIRIAVFGQDIHKILPVIDTDGSDSAMFDNALEMLTLTGRTCRTQS